MKNNKFVKCVASSMVALGISTIAYSNSWAENLKVGVAGPYTGEKSNYGISAKNGVTLAIKHINAAGGVLGTDLEAVSQDGACDSVKAARVAENMIAENVIAVIGHICNNFDRSSFAQLHKRKYSGYLCCFDESKTHK